MATSHASLRATMRELTIEAMQQGWTNSSAIRGFIAARLSVTFDWKLTNTHAWALVDLQSYGRVIKIEPGTYRLAGPIGSKDDFAVHSPSDEPTPPWAVRMLQRANRRNGPNGPSFSRDDLTALWDSCGGKCAVTGLDFSLRPNGKSLVKRTYAPSLDRRDNDRPYTRENCRLVLVAINFSLNAWGDDTYLRLARAAVARAPIESGPETA